MKLVCIFKGEELVFSFSTRNPKEDLCNLGFAKVNGEWIGGDGSIAVVYSKEA